MAKRKTRTAKGTPGGNDEGIYVFLIKNTELGSTDESQWRYGATEVTKKIRDEFRGDCTFYLTTGETYDAVSIVTGLSPRYAVEVSRFINSFGTVIGTRLSGIQMTK